MQKQENCHHVHEMIASLDRGGGISGEPDMVDWSDDQELKFLCKVTDTLHESTMTKIEIAMNQVGRSFDSIILSAVTLIISIG